MCSTFWSDLIQGEAVTFPWTSRPGGETLHDKYSKEQRERAVDLYIKYERCATGVIRELAPAGFFGRLKQEFFDKRSFAGVSMDGFINMLDEYMVWYRDKRIKTEFGMSIMDRRRRLGLVA